MYRLQMTPATQLRELHAGIGRGSKASSPPAHPKPPLSPSPSLRCLQTADKDQVRLSYQQQHVVEKQCSLHCLLKARVDSVLNLATCAARLRSPASPAQTPQLGEAATAARERSGEGWEEAVPWGRRPGHWRTVGGSRGRRWRERRERASWLGSCGVRWGGGGGGGKALIHHKFVPVM